MRTITFVASLLLSSVGAHASSPPNVDIRFAAKSVIMTGTPGGQMVVFAISREFTRPKVPVLGLVRRATVLSDVTRSGVFTFDLGEAVPEAAIWVAIDLTSGAHAIAEGRGFSALRADSLSGVLKHDNAGQLNKVALKAPELEMVLVRPGEGAWHLYAVKNGRHDENAGMASRPIRADVSAMEPLGGSGSPPTNVHNGDVIAIVDPEWLKYGLVEVGR